MTSSTTSGDPDTKRCEAGSLAEVWRELSAVTLAQLRVNGKTYSKLSELSRYARKLFTLCNVPSLEEILSE